MKQELETQIAAAVQSLFGVEIAVELTRPEEKFGDFATNIALQLSKQLGKNPREVADSLASRLQEDMRSSVNDITVAGPGFINLRLTDQSLLQATQAGPQQSLQGKTIVAEYSDPNPFKVLHAGHLYTTITGNSVARLMVAAGGNVHRVNFGGDVGLHVGKTMWGILRYGDGQESESPVMDEQKTLGYIMQLSAKTLEERATFMAVRYTEGNDAYEDDETARQQIIEFNKRVYQVHDAGDHETAFAKIYWQCRDWSYQYFTAFYEAIGVDPFEKYFPESETAPLGVATVREHLGKGVYEESDGAVVFRGEPYGLHTRVFINSNGLPTYEAKDVGLIMEKWAQYHFDLSVIITGNDIVEYMKVMLKSVEQFAPEPAERTRHLTHGQVKLEGGVKMSSRKGNVLFANDILAAADTAAAQRHEGNSAQTANAAVKYAFLKQRLGGDIIYNPQESVSLEGNSGPYLQYAHARARSILSKSDGVSTGVEGMDSFEAGERTLVRKISEYSEVVDKAVAELLPHYICTYLYELSQEFNRFYEHNRVIGETRETLRLGLVRLYADTLRSGLSILGIASPDKM